MSEGKKKKKQEHARDDAGKFVKKAEALENQDQVILQADRQAVDDASEVRGAVGGDVAPDPRNHAQTAEQYPTKFLRQQEEQDRLQQLKYDLQKLQGTAGVTPYGKLQWSDDVGYWLLRKEEAAKKAQFQQWFANQYDKWGPAQKKIARQLYPQFYEERMRTLEDNLEMAKKVARVRLRGVESAEDLALEFAAQKGLIDMSVLVDVIHPEKMQDAAGSVARFKAGLFNTNTRFLGQPADAEDAEEYATYFSGDNVAGAGAQMPNQFLPTGLQSSTNTAVLKAMGFV